MLLKGDSVQTNLHFKYSHMGRLPIDVAGSSRAFEVVDVYLNSYYQKICPPDNSVEVMNDLFTSVPAPVPVAGIDVQNMDNESSQVLSMGGNEDKNLPRAGKGVNFAHKDLLRETEEEKKAGPENVLEQGAESQRICATETHEMNRLKSNHRSKSNVTKGILNMNKEQS